MKIEINFSELKYKSLFTVNDFLKSKEVRNLYQNLSMRRKLATKKMVKQILK